jgi:hypothetical protein
LVAIETSVRLLVQGMVAMWVWRDVEILWDDVFGQVEAEVAAASSLEGVLDDGCGCGRRV